MSDFDRLDDRYEELVERSISFSGRDHEFFLAAKANRLLALSRRLGAPEQLRVLDVGCGDGVLDSMLRPFEQLVGVDPSAAMVEAARRNNPGADYQVSDEASLPFEDASFDLVFTVCVLHHVEPAVRRAFSDELARVVRPGGLVAVFEHNPLNPLTRLAVSRCEFDEDAVLLRRSETTRLLRDAGLAAAESRYILFFPWRWDRVERALGRVPFGAQYYVAATK